MAKKTKEAIQVTKKQAILIFIGIIILVALGLFGGFSLAKNTTNQTNVPQGHTPIASLERKQLVTKQFKSLSASNKNIKVYNGTQSQLHNISVELDTGVYDRVLLLIYSDGCPNCNRHINQLSDYAQKHATGKTLVLAANNGRNTQVFDKLSKVFYLPEYFAYPTVFTYDGQKVKTKKQQIYLLQNQETLYREKDKQEQNNH